MAYNVGHNKKALLVALEESLGIITTACKSTNIGRSSFYEYYNSDEEFKKSVDDIGEIAIDFVETQLFTQIKENNPTSTIFYLKSKAKHRGFSEIVHNEHTGKDGKPIELINVDVSDEDAVNTYLDMIKRHD